MHAENAITRLQLRDGANLAHVRDIPLPEAGTGFGLPLIARPYLSSDGSTALLTYTTTATPLHPVASTSPEPRHPLRCSDRPGGDAGPGHAGVAEDRLLRR